MLRVFADAQVTELYVALQFVSDWRHLITFLSIQTCLEKLTLIHIYDIPDDADLPSKLNCKLKRLMVIVRHFPSAKFLQFMNLFSSVDELSVFGPNEASVAEFLPSILTNFKSLKTLLLHNVTLPTVEFYELNKQLRSQSADIDFLVLNEITFNNDAELTGFFSLFSSVKFVNFIKVTISEAVTAATKAKVFDKLVFLKPIASASTDHK